MLMTRVTIDVLWRHTYRCGHYHNCQTKLFDMVRRLQVAPKVVESALAPSPFFLSTIIGDSQCRFIRNGILNYLFCNRLSNLLQTVVISYISCMLYYITGLKSQISSHSIKCTTLYIITNRQQQLDTTASLVPEVGFEPRLQMEIRTPTRERDPRPNRSHGNIGKS